MGVRFRLLWSSVVSLLAAALFVAAVGYLEIRAEAAELGVRVS